MAERGLPPAPAALTAFLRGVERRAALTAQLQCGDAEAGDVALSAAMRAFRRQVGGLPLVEWPVQFWSLLAAVPSLRQNAPTARWPNALNHLATLQIRDRAALLLRLAGGLDEEEGAEVLGQPLSVYQESLARACPRKPDGNLDAAAWRQLADAIQQQLRDLNPDRLARLARLRESALSGERMSRTTVATATRTPVGNDKPASPTPQPFHRGRWALVVIALSSLAMLATYDWPWSQHPPAGIQASTAGAGLVLTEEPGIEQEELPAAGPPAARFDQAFADLSHPDFELLMQPEEEAIADQADFLAWYLAGQAKRDAAEAPHVAP